MSLDQLGCGQYSAQVWTRGGDGLLFDRLPVTGATWERVLDDTSAASVALLLGGTTEDCARALRDSEPLAYELALVRDSAIVWQGPITTRSAQGPTGELAARDVTAWWDRRFAPIDRTFTDTDTAAIFAQVAADAMLEDSSPNVTVTPTPTGIVATRSYSASASLIVGAMLRELTTAGVDWTAVGRTVLVGGIVIPAAPIVLLQDGHLAGVPPVSQDGLVTANRVRYVGPTPEQGVAPVTGEARDEASILRYGLADVLFQSDQILDEASATAAAASRLALVRTPPVILTEITLAQTAPVLIEQLIPGAVVGCAFESSGIEVAGAFRLKGVKVTAQGRKESVSLTLQPLGSGGTDS